MNFIDPKLRHYMFQTLLSKSTLETLNSGLTSTALCM